jgi:hypothetical protein
MKTILALAAASALVACSSMTSPGRFLDVTAPSGILIMQTESRSEAECKAAVANLRQKTQGQGLVIDCSSRKVADTELGNSYSLKNQASSDVYVVRARTAVLCKESFALAMKEQAPNGQLMHTVVKTCD